MILAITGTPGTGKTSVAEETADRLDMQLVDVNDLARKSGAERGIDTERDAVFVDVDRLADSLDQKVSDRAVLDGHLSHHFAADITIVLRCDPDELRDRLEEKGWDEEKIRENIEAETLDILLQEAVSMRDTVYEINTTGKDASEVAQIIKRLVDQGTETDQYEPGHIEWDVADHLGV